MMKYLALLVLCLCSFMISFSRAQDSSNSEYLKALTTIYAVSKIGGFVKDWCDARAPQTKAVTDKAFVAWRKTHQLDALDKRFKALVGTKLEQINANLEQKRDATYANLDAASKDPGGDCLGLEKYLNSEVNPQKLYPAEYKLVFSQAAPAPDTSAVSVKGTVYTVGVARECP
jgi:hypothetical protein